jgi:phosphomannomutase
MPIRFGTDGWRAIIGWDFTADNVRDCAKGVATYLRKVGMSDRGLVVGYDTRFASEQFAAEVAMVTTGSRVPTLLSKRCVPTPVLSYNILHNNAGGGVVITASHNPPEWNGFKYKPYYGGSASPEIIVALESEIDSAAGKEHKRMSLQEGRNSGLLKDIDPGPPYFEKVNRLVDIQAIKDSGLNVVCDVMYGAGAGYLPRLLEGGSLKFTELHHDPNPLFPGMQQPEPVEKNLTELSQWVISNKNDVGIALDGDADRFGLVDEHGRFITSLQTFALLALYLLDTRGERGPIVKSITMTSMLYRLGEIFQVPVLETPVGFKYIGPMMMRHNALVAGEESGGYAFRGHIPERDGIVSALFFLDLIVKTGKRPSELVDYLFSKVGPHQFGRKDVPFSPQERPMIEQRVALQRPDSIAGRRVLSRDEIDGVRFTLDGGDWVLIRFSGTEPLIRLYAESESKERVDSLIEEVSNFVGV